MKKLTKLLAVLAGIVVLTAALGGCGKNNLADAFDKAEVEKQAQEDVENSMNGTYEDWVARFAPELQASLTEEVFTQYQATLEEAGEFQEFGKCAVVGQEQNGVDYAVAVLEAKHADKTFRYTIAYDEKMQLVQYTMA